jgi:predicted transcriptional regulator
MTLRSAHRLIELLCDDYEDRKVLRYILEEKDLSLGQMSEKLNMREINIEKSLRRLEENGLLIINK